MTKILTRPFLKFTLSVLTVSIFFASCKKDEKVTPTFSVNPGEGAGNDLITVTGTNIGDLRSIVFDNGNISAGLNPNFNTGSALLFRVPPDANVGDQHIIFTNAAGYEFSVPFKVLAIPTITSAMPTEWEAGSTITIERQLFIYGCKRFTGRHYRCRYHCFTNSNRIGITNAGFYGAICKNFYYK